jgi:DNA-binding transcriptional regulator YbjK
VGDVEVPRRGRPPVHNRADLLESAARVVVERGYDGLRYQDLSDASGVPVASLRHYFPTIDGLRREALMHSVRLEMEQLSEHVAQFDDPWQQICELIAQALGTTAAQRRFSWLLWLEYWRNCARDDSLGRHSGQIDIEWTEMTQKIVDAGVASGLFVLDQSSQDAAYEVGILIDGVGYSLAICPDDDELARRCVAQVTRASRRLLGVCVWEGGKERPAETGDV